MRILSIIFFLLGSIYSFGQNKVLTTDSDTTFWYSHYQQTLKKIGVKTLSEENNEFTFRIYNGVSIIELTNSKGELRASIHLFLSECSDLPREESRLYKSQAVLSSETVLDLKHLIDDFDILKIPSDKFIDGWEQNGLDGITYIIEYSDKESYAAKKYWTPNYKKHRQLKESRFIRYFLNELNQLEEILKVSEKFLEKQPFKSHYQFLGSSGCVVKIK